MCAAVESVRKVADEFIKKTHEELAKGMSMEDKIVFVNSLVTLTEHAEYLKRKLVA